MEYICIAIFLLHLTFNLFYPVVGKLLNLCLWVTKYRGSVVYDCSSKLASGVVLIKCMENPTETLNHDLMSIFFILWKK